MRQGYLIYCHINKLNGKRYIGLTKHVNNLEKRWRSGLGYLSGHQKVFAAAINKYGWDNFEHIILEDDIATLEEANQREKFYIALYHSYVGDPECNGYNATMGGDGSCGRVFSQEEREYRRKLKLGTHASLATREKMSKTRSGKPQNMTDKKIKACAKAAKAMCAARRKQIICLETGEIWESITAASKSTGISASTISACLNKKQKTAHGLHYEFC